MTENEKKKSNKWPWQILFAACAVYGTLELLGSLFAWLMYLSQPDPVHFAGKAASIGIIGGADGPTAVFVTTPGWTGYIVPVLCLVTGIWGFLWLRKYGKK